MLKDNKNQMNHSGKINRPTFFYYIIYFIIAYLQKKNCDLTLKHNYFYTRVSHTKLAKHEFR